MPEMAPAAPPRPQPCMARGREGRGETTQASLWESPARAPPHLDLAESSCCPQGGWCVCPPSTAPSGGHLFLLRGPAAPLAPASWALKSRPGSSGAQPGPSPHPTAPCSRSRQPDFWDDWGRAPLTSTQPCPQKSPALQRGSQNRAAQVHTLIPTRPHRQSTLPSQGAAGRPAPAVPTPSLQPKLTLSPPPQPQARLSRGAGRGRVGGVLGAPPTPAPLQPGLSLVGNVLGRQTEAPRQKELLLQPSAIRVAAPQQSLSGPEWGGHAGGLRRAGGGGRVGCGLGDREGGAGRAWGGVSSAEQTRAQRISHSGAGATGKR